MEPQASLLARMFRRQETTLTLLDDDGSPFLLDHNTKHRNPVFFNWVVLAVLFSFVYFFFAYWVVQRSAISSSHSHWAGGGDDKCSAFDVVYLWVNGSDPTHQQAVRDRGGRGGRDNEYGVLRYSMRSVAKYMPYVRKIHLVTNGQIPRWLDTTSERLNLVFHKDFYTNSDDLPTFNSNSIESHMVDIPGLAPCFLYLNDDVFLFRDSPRNVFYNPKNGAPFTYMSHSNIAPMEEKMKTNTWHRSVAHSNELLNLYYYPDQEGIVERFRYPGHSCHFMKRTILEVVAWRWREEFAVTSSHPFRRETDTSLPFLHTNVALKEFGARWPKWYTSQFGYYNTWSKDHEKNMRTWKDIRRRSPHCVCLNDELDGTAESIKETRELERLFEKVFPEPSFLEK